MGHLGNPGLGLSSADTAGLAHGRHAARVPGSAKRRLTVCEPKNWPCSFFARGLGAALFRTSQREKGTTTTTVGEVGPPSVWRQLRVLTVRDIITGSRTSRHRAAQMLVMAILTAMFWWQMPDDTDAFVMERFSILFFCIIAQSNAVVFGQRRHHLQ